MADKAVVTQSTLDAIGQAIIAKGGATAAMTPAQMPAAIQSIPSGGGTSYPVAWKNDGKTHVWIRITPDMMPRNEFNFGRWMFHRETSGSVTIDWGDGTTPYSFTVGDATTIGDVRHVYAEPGDYEVVIDGYDAITDFGAIYLFEWATNFNSPTRNTFRSSQSVVQIEFSKVKTSNFGGSRSIPNIIAFRIDEDCDVPALGNLLSCIKNVRVLEYLGSKRTSIANNSFQEFINLSKIVLPATVTDYGQQAFYSCRALSVDMVLNDGVTQIRPYVFALCSLHSVDIPSSVTSIGVQAFLNVSTMAHVIVRAVEPPTLENINAFQGHSGRFYVPYGCSDAYKAAVNWQTFASRIFELDEDGNIPAA